MSTFDSEIVRAARAWLGTPYRHQASTLGHGCDCLGLIRGVWREIYGDEPSAVPTYSKFPRDRDGARQLERAAEAYLLRAPHIPTPGAVILFKLHTKLPPRHCAIMSGPETFVHAQERVGVVEAVLNADWRRQIHAVYHFSKKVIN